MIKPPKRKGNRANKDSYVPSKLEIKSFEECTPTQKLALNRIKKMKLNRQRFVEIEKYFDDQISKSENKESVTLSAKLINVLCYGLGQGRSNVRKNIGNYYQRSGLINVTPREHKGMVFNKVKPGMNLGRHPKNGRVRAIPQINKHNQPAPRRVASTSKKKKKTRVKIKIPNKKINLSKNNLVVPVNNNNKLPSLVNSNDKEKKGKSGDNGQKITKSNNNLIHENFINERINGIFQAKKNSIKNVKENEKEKEKAKEKEKEKEKEKGKEKNNKKKQMRIFDGSDKNYNSNGLKPENQEINKRKNKIKRFKLKINSTFGSRKRKSPTNPKNIQKINIVQDQISSEKTKVIDFKKKKRVNRYNKKIEVIPSLQKQLENKEDRNTNKEKEKEKEKAQKIEIEIEIEKTRREILETETNPQTTNCNNTMEMSSNHFSKKDSNAWIKNPFQSKINQIIFSKQVDNSNTDVYGLLILLDFLDKVDNKKYSKTFEEIEYQAQQANNQKLLKYIKQKKIVN
ncbi:hypothetical protein M0812_12016 [Anaeramoeba flamelloides]|uniref:Uncharacterized protein n=1 Tax=Anaeramoeba flamelloides TaxID=1746091 RepID=A0AAV7ZNP1_9EUKA|nr:hypothetical protein M0812_12016 [Anaeramoeba flamelloides]